MDVTLPATKPGTPLYFDFPRPLSPPLLSFQHIGSILYTPEEAVRASSSSSSSLSSSVAAAVAASGSDGSSGGGRECQHLGPTGLSGKVRLFRYVPAAEMSGWAQFSAI